MRKAFGWCLSLAALFWLWLLLAGDWNTIELIAAGCAAAVATAFGAWARERAGTHARLPAPWLRRGWSAFAEVFVDFAILVWALAAGVRRREVVRGEFIRRPFRVAADEAGARGIRTWVAYLATLSPNAYVIDFDVERELVLVHDLVRRRRSESPA